MIAFKKLDKDKKLRYKYKSKKLPVTVKNKPKRIWNVVIRRDFWNHFLDLEKLLCLKSLVTEWDYTVTKSFELKRFDFKASLLLLLCLVYDSWLSWIGILPKYKQID